MRNKRNYGVILEILSGGEELTTREVHERFLNSRSITKSRGETKRRTHIPNFKQVQNLLQSSPNVVRANPNSNKLAKWKLREEE